MEDFSVFIIAGGKSSRMGADKAFLDVAGKTLIERAIEQTRGLSSGVFIVGPKEKFSSYGAVVEDVYAGCGPLGGIHAALKRTGTEYNLMLAVDMPFIQSEFLRYMVAEARVSGAVVTVPRLVDGYQPLCAVYRKEFLYAAEAALEARNCKIDALFPPESTRVLEAGELAELGFESEMFDNLNSPLDYERAKSKISGSLRNV